MNLNLAKYQNLLRTPQEIADLLEPNWICCSDIATAIPSAILTALQVREDAGNVVGLEYHSLLDLFQLPSLETDRHSPVRGISWFSGAWARKAVNAGCADVMPCHYRDIPSLFQKYVPVDALLAVVAPMDEHGFFSTGLSASISEVLIHKAKRIFLEVNPHMPRVASGPQIHISQVTALCENEQPIPEKQPGPIDPVSRTIGGLIAEEICNGATLQLGIGAIPDAVGLALRDKSNLGIHTEMFTDSMVDLIECGAVTNAMKPIHTGRTVATFAFGSRRMYDFIDNDPAFEMLPVDYVNDPATIAKHPNFVSVNAALEVDFFGQVCAESIGTAHVSGSGGQADYVRGAIQSPGGKSFIAFPSTAKNGTVSRIKSILSPGSLVTTSKNDVDYVVTEYGIAELRGKPLSKRTQALISIAHPRFRDELTYEAKKRNILI